MSDIRLVPIDDIRLSGENMRLDAGEIDELADSIRTIGLLQPLVLTDGMVLVCGHRRLAACRRAGMSEVPATIRRFTSEEAFVALYTENVNRKSLSGLEEALALKKLSDSGRTQEEIAGLIGKSAYYVQGYLSLLKLPDETQQAVHRGELPIWKAIDSSRQRRGGIPSGTGTYRWQASYLDRITGWVEGGNLADDSRIDERLKLLYQALSAYFGEASEQVSEERRCRHTGCSTPLSRFNRGIYCGAHERQHTAVG